MNSNPHSAIITVLVCSVPVVVLLGHRRPALAVRLSRFATLAALCGAVALTARSTPGPTQSLFITDRLGTTVSVFVAAMAVVIGAYASRSLAADRRAPRFFAAGNALTASTIALAGANRPWVMAISWLAVSASVVALIGYDGRTASRRAAHRAARVFLIGDAAVVVGIVLSTWLSDGGTTSIRGVAESTASHGPWAALLVGGPLLVGALVRSAQPPFSGWLASSVAAPTPVSALLHAGVVNGSAILLLRWSPLLSASTVVTVVGVGVAACGVLAGMAVGRAKPDVKGGLAWTTVAQMGFMMIQCLLGLAGPALVHLVAHGMFKSSLFLGAGSGLDGAGTHRHPSRVRPRPAISALASVAAAALVAAALMIVRPEFLSRPAAIVPVAFGWVTLAYGLAQWWARARNLSFTRVVGPVLIVGASFTGLLSLSAVIDHGIGSAGEISTSWLAAPLGIGVVALIAAAWLSGVVVQRRSPRLERVAWSHIAAASPPVLRSGARTIGHAPWAQTVQPRSSADPARRARIRSTITTAASTLAPSWPVDRFVSINPLLRLEGLPVEAAVLSAARTMGVQAELDESTFRAMHQAGRISDDDLSAAIVEHHCSTRHDVEQATEETLNRIRVELLSGTPVALPAARAVLLSEWHDLATGASTAEQVDRMAAWWCAAYLGDHPVWAMPGRADGLYASWRALAFRDPRPARLTGDSFANLLASLPDRPDDAVLQLLVELGVDRRDHVDYLRRHLSLLPGWASALIRSGGIDGDDLIAYLAIRLTVEAALLSNSADRKLARHAAKTHQPHDQAPDAADEMTVRRLAIWREAYERGDRDRFLTALKSAAQESPVESVRPDSQVVFCMDPRSEGLRRHLEAIGPHETIGFVGFFGLPVEMTDLDATESTASCPVIVEPQFSMVETTRSSRPVERSRRLAALHAAHDVFAVTKRSTVTPFALAETFGWLSGLWMTAKTLAPTTAGRIASAAHRRLLPDTDTHVGFEHGAGWNDDEAVAIAASILRTTGLDRDAAPLVLLCGHGSRHVNNLHHSALDCGACGGRPGGNNARAAAGLLNDPRVRSELAGLGIEVPTDTWFVAAEHDTTSDIVRILDRNDVPLWLSARLDALDADLAEAGRRRAAERGQRLPHSVGRVVGASASRVQRRGHDWAQVVPEWGLVNNAALVIGARSLTSECDLDGRVFLHSYDAAADFDGSILAAIMGGPLLVAHWISSQYRLSAIDPEHLSAGTKAAHNLVGGVGVLEGADGDLRLGLPLESIAFAGRRMHEPMRLLVVIDAPADRVEQAVATNEAVAQIVNNGWIRLVTRPATTDDEASSWSLRQRNGTWDHMTQPVATTHAHGSGIAVHGRSRSAGVA